MTVLLEIAELVAAGHAEQGSKFPPALLGQPGVVEKVTEALEAGLSPEQILHEGLMAGMEVVGRRFGAGEIFVPEVLMASKAMKAGMELLKPLLGSGAASRKGVFVLGTVLGDVHDIGKNLVRMIVEGAGWEVIDLGTNVAPERFVEAVRDYRPVAVGLSALLTTTMQQMSGVIAALRSAQLEVPVIVGGAPVNERFASEIGAAYGRDPQAAVTFLARQYK
ncbi:MAG: corrinoid protein [Candidatus Sumerlaeaceae bacterium]|nr:corrinoid protein [Candidatus Sumerlaeaceae bacterium]